MGLVQASLLVVDDHQGVRFLLKEVLEQDGYQVRALAHGRDVMPEIKRDPPDVILLDWNLPGWQGWEVLVELQNLSLQIPVILLTGWADGELFRRALEKEEVIGYLVKPFDLNDLKKMILKALTVSPRSSLSGNKTDSLDIK
ncbi:MAG: response regulator [Bacillota bacterium]|nr:response regulator [Bacillota bacterium]